MFLPWVLVRRHFKWGLVWGLVYGVSNPQLAFCDCRKYYRFRLFSQTCLSSFYTTKMTQNCLGGKNREIASLHKVQNVQICVYKTTSTRFSVAVKVASTSSIQNARSIFVTSVIFNNIDCFKRCCQVTQHKK